MSSDEMKLMVHLVR